jgi:hypothetical protein
MAMCDPYQYSTTTATGSAIAAGSPMYFSSTYGYDPRTQSGRVNLDLEMRKEFLRKVEEEFMDRMEPRIWKRLEAERDRQEKLVHKYRDVGRKRSLIGIGEPPPKSPEPTMYDKMREAYDNTVYKPAYRAGLRVKVGHETVLKEMNPLEKLWHKVDTWLSTKSIRLEHV